MAFAVVIVELARFVTSSVEEIFINTLLPVLTEYNIKIYPKKFKR